MFPPNQTNEISFQISSSTTDPCHELTIPQEFTLITHQSARTITTNKLSKGPLHCDRMFPPNQTNEISFQISSSTTDPYHELTIPQDFTLITPQSAHTIANDKLSKGRPENPFRTHKDDKKTTGSDNHSKSVMRRDIERQRRKEMTTLYTSLRNLLPSQYIKGKRAISDHIHETVNYIKDEERKIEKLKLHIDELKKQSDSMNPADDHGSTHVTVCSSSIGIEVVIDTGLREQVLQLSQALELLLGEGLNVVSCVSAKVNQRKIHTIQSEVSYMACIDTSKLQTKLIEAIPSSNTENFG